MNNIYCRDLLVGLVLSCISVFSFFYLTPEYVVEGSALGISPRFFPKVGIAIVGVCAFILMLVSIKEMLASSSSKKQDAMRLIQTIKNLPMWKAPLIIVIALLSMSLVFEKFGYFYAIPAVLFIMMLIFGMRSLLVLITVSVLVPIILFALFNYGLNMPLM
jgi:hypothetical protein